MAHFSLLPAFRILAIKWVWRSVSSGRMVGNKIFDPMRKRVVSRDTIGLSEEDMERLSKQGSDLISESLLHQTHFTLVEAAWLRFIQIVEANQIPLSELEGMLNPIVSERSTVRSLLASPLFKKAILILLPKNRRNDATAALEYPNAVADNIMGLIPSVSLFDALVCANALQGISLSLFRDINGKWSLISYDLLKEGVLDSSEMTKSIHSHGVSISINGLLEGLNHTVPLESTQLLALSENEKTLMGYLRNETILKSLAIRFDKDGEMTLLELTRTQILETMKQVESLITDGSFYNIQIETGDGKIIKFENTKKIRLK